MNNCVYFNRRSPLSFTANYPLTLHNISFKGIWQYVLQQKALSYKAPKIAGEILQEDNFFEAYKKYKSAERPKSPLLFDLKTVLENAVKAALSNNEEFTMELLKTNPARLCYVDKYFPMLGVGSDDIDAAAAKGLEVLDNIEAAGANPYGLTLESFRNALMSQ